MGLYDSVLCERSLPDGCTERDFQTKSLGCAMNTFRLAADGRLRGRAGADTGFHGVMRFYTSTTAGRWHEYEAKFTDGLLVHLLCVADARYDADGLAIAPQGPA